MPQISSNTSAKSIFPETVKHSEHIELADVEKKDPPLHSGIQLKSVMSELNRLSESFVNSYQTLETQVEKLNGQLENEAAEKQSALQEKQQLLIEKASLSDRLQNLLAIMPAGVVVIDGNGRVKDCNAVAVDILGRPLLGQLWLEVINRAFEPQADDGHQISLKDGRKIHIETRALDTEPGQLVVLTDLTKTRQLQAELSQQQKLSSMGKMIASLAHQIRTPLSAAILYGSHLKNPALGSALKQQFSDHLMERLHCMERQVTDMLNFMKGERKQKAPVSVADLFNTLKNQASDLLSPIAFESGGTPLFQARLLADRDALVGGLLNLLQNACDACYEIDKPKISVSFQLDERLVVSIRDNGVGIAENDQKKIFEPFFTNKKHGNGLGLAIVHGIVIDHQGSIKVKSRQNSGSCFEISFPLLKEEVSTKQEPTIQQESEHEC